jgi:dihydropteroate synthase
MKIIKLNNSISKEKLFEKIGSTEEGSRILKDKANLNLIYIKDIKAPAANILKQDALSIGADLAVSKDTVTCRDEIGDAVLIANNKQLKKLTQKEMFQPFGLKEFAKELKSFINLPKRDVEVMGVVNANEDSFYSGSRFQGAKALLHIEKLIEDGADIIDIGGVSSRPGSKPVSEEEEFKRLEPIIDEIYQAKLYEKVKFSLDSYSLVCCKYALEKGFSIINDITALQNDKIAKVVGSYGATVVLMHKKGTPKDMQKNPTYENVLTEIDDFFIDKIENAKNFGIKDIVLDVGIGFGKTLEHNLMLIKHHSHFLHFGYPLLIGASRKSMIDMITPSKVEDRLFGTLAIHLEVVRNGASIVRVHDVKEHVQALKVQKAIDEVGI